MKNWKVVTITTLIAASAGVALAADGSCEHTKCDAQFPDSIASPNEIAVRHIAGRMIHSLTPQEQEAIAAAHGIGSDALHLDDFTYEVDRTATEGLSKDITPSEYKDIIISDELWARMTPNQRGMIDAIVNTLESGDQPPALCFAPDMDREIAYAINQMIEFRFSVLFQQTNRWNGTATDGGGLQQGEPTTLTYSYVPDGTFVPDLGIGLGSGNSTLFQWLNGIYGSPATWQPLFDQVFDRWADLTGLSYVYEPNDDGVNLNSAAGVLGVRGDIRISAFNYPNDGNNGVLAYNNFPQDGDMAFDAFDTFYNGTGGNSIRFRNVAAHEHGHGLGMLHVCPIQETKLMEPFVTTSFDGPQLDDILNGHRHYGDPMEPNDSPFAASDLGSADASDLLSVGNISLDDNSDADYFSINLTEPAHIFAIATPAAGQYQQGTQTQACNTGAVTNYNAIHNLRLSIFEPGNLLTPSLVVDANGTGSSETLDFDGLAAGEYIIRVDTTSSTNSVQRYTLGLVTSAVPFQGPALAATPPSSIDPGVTTDFSVEIDPREDSIVGGSAQLFTSVNGGSFTASALSPTGGNNYTATLPAVNCDDTLEFYVAVEGDTDGVNTLPAAGAAAPFSVDVGMFAISFADNFQTNMNWAVSGPVANQGAGRWERGNPAGDGSRGDAPDDADGSGQCYLTGNGGAGSNTDVDGGSTILTSPMFDISGNPEASISYYRWFHNSFGDNANLETFQVDISDNDGASWTGLETVAGNSPESNGGWFQKSFRIADFVGTTSQMRVRFIAKDDIGAVVEAAVDGIEVSGLLCEDPMVECPGDLNGDGETDFLDISAFLAGYNNQMPIADFNGDGQYDFLDISAFLAAYGAGCP